jgi:cell division protein FtsI/penicillin-binding protein 2
VTQARVEGYRVAGKTGTAQIPIPGGYDKEGTITSFVGFGPVPNPQLVILVKLDRPKTSPWCLDTAAPTFSRLATRLFLVLGIPPEGVQVAEAGG